MRGGRGEILTNELTDSSKLGVRMSLRAGGEVLGVDAVGLTRQANILGAVGIIQNTEIL